MPGKLWGFTIGGGNRDRALNLLKIYEISVHTVEEHVERLGARYSSSGQALGKQCFFPIFIDGDWYILNPKSRWWDGIAQYRAAAVVREGSILRNINSGQTRFFWFKGLDANGEPKLIELQERAAWNIASKYFEHTNIYCIEHEQQHIGSISLESLGHVPDDVFAALAKLNPLEQHLRGVLIFEMADYDLVRKILSYINTSAIKATKIVKLPNDVDKLHGTPVVLLAEAPQDRLDSLKIIIEEATGIKLEPVENMLEGSKREIYTRILFIGKERGCFADGIFYVPLDALEDVLRVLDLATSICELNNIEVETKNLEKLVATWWSVKNDGDANFMLDALLRYIDDGNFVHEFMAKPQNREIAKNWHDNLVRNHFRTSIPNALLKKVGDYLAVWPNINIEKGDKTVQQGES